MRKDCIYKYIRKEQPQKDIVIYQYGDKVEYIIPYIRKNWYKTYDLNNIDRKINADEFRKVWFDSNILWIYEQSNCIFLQVNWNR